MGYVDWKNDCPNLLRQFLNYLSTIKERSPKTIEAYYIDIRTFLRFLKLHYGMVPGDTEFGSIRIGDLSDETICGVSLYDVLEYLQYMKEEHGNSAKTRARKTSALRVFYKFLFQHTTLLKQDPLETLEIPAPKKSLPKHLTLEESRSLLSYADDGAYSERDHCIFTLFLNCGMRLSELVGINLSDIHDNTIQITGKGNKQRVVYLNQACLDALAAYLSVRNRIPDSKDKDALFLSHQKRRISNRRVQQVLEDYLRRLGLQDKGYTVHKLRHTAATLMYQYGHVDIRVLQLVLGHENLGTTQIYTHVANEQVQQAMESSPLADLKPLRRKRQLSSSGEEKDES